MKRSLYVADAFTRRRFDGNPAGVMVDAEGIPDALMQAVAREVNASETAFVLPGEGADFRFRFFTPSSEVPFCGHAFVAAVTVLLGEGRIRPGGDFGRIVVETGAGRHPTDMKREEGFWRVEMTQAEPAFGPAPVPADVIARALGADLEALRADLPLELAYTGLWHLLVPLTGRSAAEGLRPDFRSLAALDREIGAVTTHVFAPDGGGWFCRDFAPAVGVDEDPVTGSASGALGAYLVRHRLVAPGVPVTLEQRRADGRGGEVRVAVEGEPGTPRVVRVGGTAVVAFRGEVELEP
jgi:PhzF family phenazine biosynthesis protein